MMKSLIRNLLIGLLLTSCVEDVDFELEQFVKVLSLDRSSFAEKIIELDNGDLMILGEMGTSAFELESTGQGSQPNELEDQAPFIAITDGNGNLKDLRMYPFEDFELEPPFQDFDILNFNNTTTFHNILPTSDGGYIVHAQSVGFDVFDPRTEEVIESQAGANVYNDFLLKLNPNLDIKEIVTMQGHPGWDGVLRFRGRLKRINNSEVGMLLTQRNTFLLDGNPASTGFTFHRVDEDLSTIATADIQQPSPLIGHDFIINDNSEITLLTSTQSDFNLVRSDINNISASNTPTVVTGTSVLQSQNRDEQFLLSLQDGSMVLVYTQPPLGVIMEHRGGNLSRLSIPISLEGSDGYSPFTIRAPRAVTLTENNDLLIFVLVIPGNTNESLSGELFRVTLSGEILFQQNILGVPGDVIETNDGAIIAVSNREYNGSLQKIHITKMDANGKLF